MDTWSNNRLTVVGPKLPLRRFLKSNWDRPLAARHTEWLENSPRRHIAIFETDRPPLKALARLSQQWSNLVLLLDFEVEKSRIKGLAKVHAGQESCQFEY